MIVVSLRSCNFATEEHVVENNQAVNIRKNKRLFLSRSNLRSSPLLKFFLRLIRISRSFCHLRRVTFWNIMKPHAHGAHFPSTSIESFSMALPSYRVAPYFAFTIVLSNRTLQSSSYPSVRIWKNRPTYLTWKVARHAKALGQRLTNHVSVCWTIKQRGECM